MKFTKNQLISIIGLIFVPFIIGFWGYSNSTKVSVNGNGNATAVGANAQATVNNKPLLIETPVGEVNGINLIFKVSHKPLYLNEDGLDRFEGLDYAYSNGKITLLNSAEAPSYAIKSFYKD